MRVLAAAVLLSGDAGIGKSRLLAELASQLSGPQDVVLLGRCLDTAEATLPYLPFVEVLGEMAVQDPDLIRSYTALGRLLPSVRGGVEQPASDRELGQLQLFDAFHSALTELAAEGTIEADVVAKAIARYDIDTEVAPPWTR